MYDIVEIEDKVFNFPTEDKDAFNVAELRSLLKDYKLDMGIFIEKFGKSIDGTLSRIGVFYALMSCLEDRMMQIIETA